MSDHGRGTMISNIVTRMKDPTALLPSGADHATMEWMRTAK